MPLCEELGIPARERSIPLEELRAADEIFFTGTTTEIRRPCRSTDGPSVQGCRGR